MNSWTTHLVSSLGLSRIGGLSELLDYPLEVGVVENVSSPSQRVQVPNI